MTRPAEAIKYIIVPYTRGAVLDLGATRSDKLFPHFVSVGGEGSDILNVVSDLVDIEDGQCDAVVASDTSFSRYVDALNNWWRVLKVGGHLVIHEHGEAELNQGRVFDEMVSMAASAGIGWDMVADETIGEGRLMVFKKAEGTEVANKVVVPLMPTVCICRFGGFGDMLQMSNILPQLKREGYRVTVMTTPKGQSIVREDPFIDDWLIQDDNQVPNHELGAYWKVQAGRFDKFVNLSESIEGTLLAMPGRANHMWPDAVRRVELNKNYLEWTAQLAEVAYSDEARFYPTVTEVSKAQNYLYETRSELDGNPPFGIVLKPRFFILWALAGSSVHKFYPWQDSVIAAVMQNLPDAVVILTGDFACEILEQGWENEPRVRRESGKLEIRDTLTLAKWADCVVGPETGVLNAVAFEDNAKVIMLSHSSEENLTKHWTNTVSLAAPHDSSVACGNGPCHRLHTSTEFCHTHAETGAAMCQLSIEPGRVFDAIEVAYKKWSGA